MTILLDIDGVLVTTPSWRVPDRLADNFMKFNENATQNLIKLYDETDASIVLTTTHRTNYSLAKWYEIFKVRGLNFKNISKLNDKTTIDTLLDRATEINEWIDRFGANKNYVVIDDDLSINRLSEDIKNRCVMTKPLIGFDKHCLMRALSILKPIQKFTCPCCGHKTFDQEVNGHYDICPVCFWEDDPIQFEDPTYEGGANQVSLRQGQLNFIEFGACEVEMKINVRLPNKDEPKDENWKPYDKN